MLPFAAFLQFWVPPYLCRVCTPNRGRPNVLPSSLRALRAWVIMRGRGFWTSNSIQEPSIVTRVFPRKCMHSFSRHRPKAATSLRKFAANTPSRNCAGRRNEADSRRNLIDCGDYHRVARRSDRQALPRRATDASTTCSATGRKLCVRRRGLTRALEEPFHHRMRPICQWPGQHLPQRENSLRHARHPIIFPPSFPEGKRPYRPVA